MRSGQIVSGKTARTRVAVAGLLFAVVLLASLAFSPQGAFAADQGASSSLAAGSADLGAVAGAQAGTTAEVEKSHAKTPTPVYAGATSMPVSSKATWTLKNCTIRGNRADAEGGGLYNGTKELTLNGTAVTYIMNGSVTTSEEDAELLEDYAELKVEVDAESFSLKVLE